MDDYHLILNRIAKVDRYKGLMTLQDEVWALRSKYPFSVFSNIRGRLEEKIHTFEHPRCDQVGINIIFMNGSKKTLEPEECIQAAQRGIKLSDFIFTKYHQAVDYEILSENIIGTSDDSEKPAESGSDKGKGTMAFEVLQTRIEFLIRMVDHINALYSETIPKISDDIKDINRRLEELYKKLADSNR
ncbi:MAG: hypothetical protein QXV22_00560 [Thermoplasmataceae archaeon]